MSKKCSGLTHTGKVQGLLIIPGLFNKSKAVMIPFGHKGITVSRIIVLQKESQGFAFAIAIKALIFFLLSFKPCKFLNISASKTL